jgi:hypothetical protein
MEYFIVLLMLPLSLVSLALTFSRARHPIVPMGMAALTASGVAPAGVKSTGLTRRVTAWLLVVGVFGGALLLPPAVHFGDNLVRLITLSRYGLLTGLFLVGLVPLALRGAPGLLANLFVLRAPRQLFHIAWMSVLVATMVVVVCRVEEMNAPDRYGTNVVPMPEGARDWIRVAAVLVMCLPVPLACARSSRQACLSTNLWRSASWDIAGVLGWATGFLMVIAVAAVQPVFISPQASADLFPLQPVGEWVGQELGLRHIAAFDGLDRFLAHLLNASGYIKGGSEAEVWLAPGHAQATAGMAVVLAVYLLYYLAVKYVGLRAVRVSQLPPLFLLLLLLLLLGFFLQGAAFALDHYWLPASVAVLLFVFAVYQFSDTDHLFSLGMTRASGGVVPVPPGSSQDAPELEQVAAKWQLPTCAGKADEATGPRRTLVAVTASGGGIQAAAWSARVLVGLQEVYGDAFTSSVRLISAVSGGSVGAMYALDAWPPGGPAWQYPADAPLPPAGSVCARAMESSLEATAWGFVFPDLLRIVAPVLVSQSDDRGARIEEAWRSHLGNSDVRMTDWIGPILDGRMPVPVFNATAVETGQRFLASPVLGRPRIHLPPTAEPRELFRLYPGSAPLVSTMVRLSATFPFVSPICRPTWDAQCLWPESDAYHFADGGYVDNEGMVTVIEWLWDLLDPIYLPQRPFDRILLVRLMPFPSSQVAQAKSDRGWFYATLGPIDAMQNVRTASQVERNELAVRLFTEAAARQGVEVRSAVLRFDIPEAAEPPLSWMLTDPQKVAIDRGWRRLVDPQDAGDALGAIDAWFPRVVATS